MNVYFHIYSTDKHQLSPEAFRIEESSYGNFSLTLCDSIVIFFPIEQQQVVADYLHALGDELEDREEEQEEQRGAETAEEDGVQPGVDFPASLQGPPYPQARR